MGTIQSSVKLHDQMSSPLLGITNALNMMVSAWDRADSEFSDGLGDGELDGIRQQLHQASEELNRMGNEQQEFNQKVQNGSNLLSGMVSKIGAMVGAYAGMQAVKGAIEYASDLAEVQNVVDVSFGKSAQAVDEWAKTTLNAYGINELSAKQFAGTMGAMLKSSGLAGEEVSDMSMRIAEMSGDMASFYNLDPAEAFAKIRSGISGETEPLKQLGINMSVANLEAYALAQGITKAYKDMSQAEQVQLRYNYLLQATADAQGDFARTSDSYANQTKLLTENWKAFTGELAGNALPVLAMAMSLMNEGISFMQEHWSVLAPLLAGVIGVITAYGVAWLATQAPMMIATIQQWALNNAIFACPIFWIVAGIIALIAVVVAVAQHIANLGVGATTAFGVIAGWINIIIQWFKNLGLTVANFALGAWGAINALASNMITAFGNSIANIKSFFYSLLSTAMSVIGQIAEALSALPFVEFDSAGLLGKAQEYADKAQAEQNSKGEYQNLGDAFSKGNSTFETFSDGWSKDAYNSGAKWGDGIANSISEKWNAFKGGGGGAMADMADAMTQTAGNTGSTAGSTGKMADSLAKSTEELKYLRDIAEQEVINRFTTAEVKVDMGGITNNVSSGTDLDGLVDYLATSLQESMEMVAEGVY